MCKVPFGMAEPDDERTPSAAGRVLVCPVCGVSFAATSPRSIYCSPAHQQAAYRERHREELKAYLRGRYTQMRAALARLEALERGED